MLCKIIIQGYLGFKKIKITKIKGKVINCQIEGDSIKIETKDVIK